MASGITIVGLGPGAPGQLTRQAWNWLEQCGEIWLRTEHHPTVAAFPKGLVVHSFDEVYDHAEKFETVYATIVERILELGRRPEGVTYARAGSPVCGRSDRARNRAAGQS